jgi:hypothetical protein
MFKAIKSSILAGRIRKSVAPAKQVVAQTMSMYRTMITLLLENSEIVSDEILDICGRHSNEIADAAIKLLPLFEDIKANPVFKVIQDKIQKDLEEAVDVTKLTDAVDTFFKAIKGEKE